MSPKAGVVMGNTRETGLRGLKLGLPCTQPRLSPALCPEGLCTPGEEEGEDVALFTPMCPQGCGTQGAWPLSGILLRHQHEPLSLLPRCLQAALASPWQSL